MLVSLIEVVHVCVCVHVLVKQKVPQIMEKLIKNVLEVEINKKHKLLFSVFFLLSPKPKCLTMWNLNNCF